MREPMIKTEGVKPRMENPYPLCHHAGKERPGIPKTCIRNYECWHCAFDQWLEALEEGQKTEEIFKISMDALAKAA